MAGNLEALSFVRQRSAQQGSRLTASKTPREINTKVPLPVCGVFYLASSDSCRVENLIALCRTPTAVDAGVSDVFLESRSIEIVDCCCCVQCGSE